MADWWELKNAGAAAQAVRKIQPISTAELERRWKAVRIAMETQGIDVLVVQGSHNYLGGYARWLTDTPAKFGFQDTILFPRDDLMTLIHHGPDNGVYAFDGNDPTQRGVKLLLTAPFYGSVHYMRHWAAERAVKELQKRGRCTIGLVATDLMSSSFVDYLKTHLTSAVTFADATELVDAIKAVKSPEERELIGAAAAAQDAAFKEVLKVIKPGMRDFQVNAAARYSCELAGCEDGLYIGSSGPTNSPTALLRRPNMQGRTITDDSYFTILIETNGPGGLYTELARSIVFGKAPQELVDEMGILREAQQHTARQLVPGANCAEIFRSHADFMRKHKRPEEERNYCHGQGYDVVERPLIRPEETMAVGKNMCFAVHPSYATPSWYAFLCDNFFVEDDGVARVIHTTEQKVFAV